MVVFSSIECTCTYFNRTLEKREKAYSGIERNGNAEVKPFEATEVCHYEATKRELIPAVFEEI